MKSVNCEICDIDDATMLFQKGRTNAPGPVVRCNRCGLVYVSSRDSEQQWIDAEVWDYYLEQLKWKKANFCDRLKRIGTYRAPGKILEIGCYVGSFLDVAGKKGWEAHGVEPAHAAGQYAKDVHGIDVFSGYLTEAAYPRDTFDVVVMLEVIEHLPSPLKELREIHRILKSDGLLFMETPNIDNFAYKILKRRWRQFIPGHNFFFSPVTIAELLSKAGFKTLRISSVPKVISVRHLTHILGVRYNKTVAMWLRRLFSGLNATEVPLKINVGDLMVIYAEKRRI